jgi:hypothetical protein
MSNFEEIKARHLGGRGVKLLDFSRTNVDVKDRTERYDITKFPKIDMNSGSVNAPATFSTLGSEQRTVG